MINEIIFDDLILNNPNNCQIGNGFDVHRLAEGRRLVLGGIDIPFAKGLLGHSDADVVVHAVMDSLLAAAELRDIGVRFPDSDDKYKDISSLVLLRDVKKAILQKGYEVISISAVVAAQQPKLASFLPQMAEKIAEVLCIGKTRVNLSATTTEGLGVVGSGDAIACYAVSLLFKSQI